MSNTVYTDGRIVNISAIDSDWLWNNATNGIIRGGDNNVNLAYIYFVPGAAAERLKIHSGQAAGMILFDSGAVTAAGDVRVFGPFPHPGFYCKPVLDFSEGTYANAATMIIIAVH
jgi:hypothetical protein